MKKITYIKTSWCPYCAQADRILKQLQEENPAYENLEIDVVDEEVLPEKASQYDYHLVPNFWVEEEKKMEGVPSVALIREVLDSALED